MATVDGETMADSHAYQSIYAAFRLARILLNVKARFKARIKARGSTANALTVNRRDTFKDDEYEEITRALNVRSRSGTLVHPRCRRKQAEGEELEFPKLLQKLDSYAHSNHGNISSVAAQDERFLEYDPQRAATINDASILRHILDLTTLLLDRLEASPGYHPMNHRKINQSDCDYLKCEKFFANLEHLLRCLQQAIVEALIHNSLKLIDADILRWHTNWRQGREYRGGWFAEWPNGQPPLNTTMPWNVKPSLVVLWGVCWMFFDHNNQVAHSFHYHNNNWMTTQVAHQQGAPLSDPLVWTGLADSATFSQDQNTSGSSWGSTNAFSHQIVGGDPDGDSYAQQSYAVSRDTRRAGGIDPAIDLISLPSQYYLFPEPSSTNLPASSNNALSDNVFLPYLTGTSSPATPYQTVNSQWPSRIDHQQQQQTHQHKLAQTLSTTSQRQSTEGYFVSGSTPKQQHKQNRGQKPHPTPRLMIETPQLEVPPYQSSPHSDVPTSGLSPCISACPVSPSLPLEPASSSTGGSPQSRREDSARLMEPRNEKGLLYCDHQDCVNESRIFTRKCEYQKHMDKHNRPYVCDEKGCEKIQGFTYSGGLLRHQREVHRQHGGPKASCMCPHRDCKRSTGTGFSRKENLSEHLRRVHRGVGDERDPPQVAATTTGSSSPRRLSSEAGPRKRRRSNDDDDDDDDVDAVESRDLRKQVRRLRREVQEKDERLKRLEQAVERLSNGRLPVSSA